jgi:outer membrane protein assembly factor BamB
MNRRRALRGDEPLTPDEAERQEVAMARAATHLLVMAVVGISMLLGHTGGALSQEVASERLLNADKDPNNWPMYYGNYQGWRYSPLQQINATNVKRLAVKWKFRTGSGDENFQVTPVVVDGIMYLTNQRNEVFALYAETGKMLWRYTYFHIEFSPLMPGATRNTGGSRSRRERSSWRPRMPTLSPWMRRVGRRCGKPVWAITRKGTYLPLPR